jgi:2-polyprenyl-3-methyl-5-hydroxy-6-metoxy-1,4-benzoquinol methylase
MAFFCPNCQGSKSDTVLFKSGYEIARCSQCSLQSVKITPEPEAILAYYQSPEYYRGSAEGYRDYMEMAKVLLPLAERRLARIEALLPGGDEQCLLDVGCAAGFFLQKAREQGWEVCGVEVAKDMAEYTQRRLGVPVYLSIESVEAKNASLDAVTAWEVIEHLAEPHPMLRHIFHLLKPGGILALSTPNTGHWRAIEYPNQWESYSPPAHLLFFNRSSLRATLEMVGFEIVSVHGSGPLPRLPGFVERLFMPVHRGLARGDAPFWGLSLYAWRVVRLLALMRDRLFASKDDVMMTLEAVARKPA